MVRNHEKSEGRKIPRVSKSKAKKSKDSKVKSFKKLYVYRSKDDGTLTVWHGKLSGLMGAKYWDLCYEITIRAVGGKRSNIVARIAAGIEFNNMGDRFEEL